MVGFSMIYFFRDCRKSFSFTGGSKTVELERLEIIIRIVSLAKSCLLVDGNSLDRNITAILDTGWCVSVLCGHNFGFL
jgi:hypothetical protein